MGTTHLRNELDSQYSAISLPLEHISGRPIVVRSNNSGFELEKYEVVGANRLQTDEKYYKLRSSSYSKNLVVVFHHLVIDRNQPRFHVCTEKMRGRMNELQKILDYVEVLCVLQAALNGFAELLLYSGQPFMVGDRMIAINDKQQIRVWAHDNFALNKLEYIKSTKEVNNENTMIYQIFSSLNNSVLEEEKGKYYEVYAHLRRINHILDAKNFVSSLLGNVNRKVVLANIGEKADNCVNKKREMLNNRKYEVHLGEQEVDNQKMRVMARNGGNQHTISPRALPIQTNPPIQANPPTQVNPQTQVNLDKSTKRQEKLGIVGILQRLRSRDHKLPQRQKQKINIPSEQFIKTDQGHQKGSFIYQRALKENEIDPNANLSSDRKNKISISLRGSRVNNNGTANIYSFKNPTTTSTPDSVNADKTTPINIVSFQMPPIPDKTINQFARKEQFLKNEKTIRERSMSPDGRLESIVRSKQDGDKQLISQGQLIYEKNEVRNLRKSEIVTVSEPVIPSNRHGFAAGPIHDYSKKNDSNFKGLLDFELIGNKQVSKPSEQLITPKKSIDFKMQFRQTDHNHHPSQREVVEYVSIADKRKGRGLNESKSVSKEVQQKSVKQKYMNSEENDQSLDTGKTLNQSSNVISSKTKEEQENHVARIRHRNDPQISFNKQVFGIENNRFRTQLLTDSTPKPLQILSAKQLPQKNPSTPDRNTHQTIPNLYNYRYITKNQEKIYSQKLIDKSSDQSTGKAGTMFQHTPNANLISFNPKQIHSHKSININGRKMLDYTIKANTYNKQSA